MSKIWSPKTCAASLRRRRRAAGECRRFGRHSHHEAAPRTAQQEHPPGGGEEQLGRRATRRHAAGSRVRRLVGNAGDRAGAARTSSALAKEIIRFTERKSSTAFRPRRGDGRRSSLRRGQASQQMAQPQEQLSILLGQILESGRRAGRPIERHRAARWPARSSSAWKSWRRRGRPNAGRRGRRGAERRRRQPY